MESIPPRGLIIDLITPLKESKSIDGRGLGQHLDRVLPHIQGVWFASPYAAEGERLDAHQREELFDKALVIVRGRLPLWIWITRETGEETEEMIHLLEKRLSARNYTGPIFWVDTPLLYHSNRGLFTHYLRLTALTRVPFMIHNDSELIKGLRSPLKRNNIRTSILKELVKIEGIQGLLFLGPLERAQNYQKATRRRADFRIYDGDEARFLSYPSASGVISAGANLAPKAWQKITKSSLSLIDGKEEYPDSLQQLWEAGEYIRGLRDAYHPDSAHLIRAILSEMRIIGSPGSVSKVDDLKERILEMKRLMGQNGDFPTNLASD